MDILFLGVSCTHAAIIESNEKYYKGNATVRPQQYFDLNLVNGLSGYSKVKAISEPPVASYPKSDCLFYRRNKDILSENLTIQYISLLNIFGLKTIIITLSIFFETIKFCLIRKRNESAIVLGYLSFYTLLPVMIVSKLFRFDVFAVVPDLPQYVNHYSKSSSRIRLALNYIFEKLNKLGEGRLDGYILLTKYMNDLINTRKKPYIVIEGFVNSDEIQFNEKPLRRDNKIVMYAGTLHEKFGIRKLIDAFKLIKNDNYELWIYGEGDYTKSIIQEAAIDNRIKYMGTKSKEEILKLERQVTLLINPRPSTEDFTKYSFPSKTLEYMSSGTPLLTTKLLGIPEEYYNYLYVFESEAIELMAKKIDSILSLPEKELMEFGLRAQQYVVNCKNHKVQAAKIIKFINNLRTI